MSIHLIACHADRYSKYFRNSFCGAEVFDWKWDIVAGYTIDMDSCTCQPCLDAYRNLLLEEELSK